MWLGFRLWNCFSKFNEQILWIFSNLKLLLEDSYVSVANLDSPNWLRTMNCLIKVNARSCDVQTIWEPLLILNYYYLIGNIPVYPNCAGVWLKSHWGNYKLCINIIWTKHSCNLCLLVGIVRYILYIQPQSGVDYKENKSACYPVKMPLKNNVFNKDSGHGQELVCMSISVSFCYL